MAAMITSPNDRKLWGKSPAEKKALIDAQRPDNTTYTFTSIPRVVQPSTLKKNYKERVRKKPPPPASEQPPIVNYGNIMFDKRIVRGNTYALRSIPATQLDPIDIQRRQENHRRALARRRAREAFQIKPPEPLEGRLHVAVQTELYLEELTDRIEEDDKMCQTDAFLDRPPSPLFVPAKSGLDVETQILENDLFHFNVEVVPILEVLVGKTIEQSLLEVMEEEEIAELRKQQREFEEMRNAELMEQQRLEEQERRHREEKERRMQQQREVIIKEKETMEKVAARSFAQGYLKELVPAVFGTLTERGYFFDEIERDVEKNFMSWLMDRTAARVENLELGRMLLDGMLREVVTQRMEAFHRLEQQALHEPSQESSETEVENTEIEDLIQDEEEDKPESDEPQVMENDGDSSGDNQEARAPVGGRKG